MEKFQDNPQGLTLNSEFTRMENWMRRLAHDQLEANEHINAKLNALCMESTNKTFNKVPPSKSSSLRTYRNISNIHISKYFPDPDYLWDITE